MRLRALIVTTSLFACTAVLAAAAAHAGGRYLANTQFLVSDKSSEVIKVTRTADLDDPNFDVSRSVYAIEICDAKTRSSCHDLVPGKTRFTAGELTAAIEGGSKTSKSSTIISVVAMGLTTFKGPVARGLTKRLGVHVTPGAVVAVGLAAVAATALEALHSDFPITELGHVQSVAAIAAVDGESPDIKVFSIPETELALKPLLRKTSTAQTPAF